jgi:hypothetical protein
MRLNILMLIMALCLGSVAAYYSIIGMTSIFNGAIIPIVIMTGILEISKLTVSSWLYNNWSATHLALKSYLTTAVLVLMLITSMGIFGFLSKANVEQVALAEEQTAQIQRISQQMDEQNTIIAQAKQRITNLGTENTTGDIVINSRIADATKVINDAMQRVQPQIDEQQHIIDQERDKIEQRVKLVQNQIDDIDKQVADLDSVVKTLSDQNKISLAQRKQNQQRIERQRLAKQKAQLLTQINDIRTAPDNIIDSANAQITKIRAKVDTDVAQAHDTINKMTAQLGQAVNTDKVQTEVDQQNQRIKTATDQIDKLTDAKFKIEHETRKLEVEVGPIKYIAQVFYGDDVDQKLLAHAVRWVIMLLIFVFDPLAVLMLIAANQGIMQYYEKNKKTKDLLTSIDTIVENIVSKPITNNVIQTNIVVNDHTVLYDINNSDKESNIPLTTEVESVTVQHDDHSENVSLLDNQDIKHDAVDLRLEVNNADHITDQTFGPILSTEGLLTTLEKAHSSRMNKSIIKLFDNQEQ